MPLSDEEKADLELAHREDEVRTRALLEKAFSEGEVRKISDEMFRQRILEGISDEQAEAMGL